MRNDIEALRAALTKLGDRDVEFATSLLNQYARKGALSPKQLHWVGKLVKIANGEEKVQTAEIGDLSGVTAIFDRALSNLKRPEIVIKVPGYANPLSITVAGERARVPGSLNVVGVETDDWFGRILRDGTFEASRRKETPEAVIEGLRAFAKDPAKLAAEHGRTTGRCCFCNLVLKDPKSKAAGMGETCARNWGLHDHYREAILGVSEEDAAVLGKKATRKKAA